MIILKTKDSIKNELTTINAANNSTWNPKDLKK